MNWKTLQVLLVEDDAVKARALVDTLPKGGRIDVLATVASLEDAFEFISAITFDAIVLDLDLRDTRGLERLRRVCSAASRIPVIVLAPVDQEDMAPAVFRSGAEECLVKDAAGLESLCNVISHAVERHAYHEGLRTTESRFRSDSEERFRLLADNIKEAFIIVEIPSGKALYLSRTWEEMWGRPVEDAYANPQLWFEAIEPEDRASVMRVYGRLASGEPAAQIFRVRRTDGSIRWVRARMFPVRDDQERVYRLVGLVEDITEIRQTEEQLRQALKMEAVGQLAGGIAHDFNNLLVVIAGYARIVSVDLGPSHPSQKDLEQIRAAAQSAANLTGQLLAFSRRQILQPQILDLNHVLQRVERLMRRVLGEDISLVMKLTTPLARVNADPGQIEQVIVNLAVNARDAMPNGGVLTIETANVDLDLEYAAQHPGSKAGRHVAIAVSDTGVGMDYATQKRLFEPFFTTKPDGKGTGLGLATVYGIVKQSEGSIWVYSELERGATFKIYLPIVTHDSGEPTPSVSAAVELHGSETVLVVEDQQDVRAVIGETLRRYGYHVLAAANGEDAINKAREHREALHLLLTDVVMPGSSGREVAREIVSEHPEVRVMYMSGYTDDAIVQRGVLDPGLAYIQKPFTGDSLLRKVRQVLDTEHPPAW
jgi:two-component system cell cycle sensor histidine kinase/response regulator CckA